MGQKQENQPISDKLKQQMTVRITPESLETAKKLSEKMHLKPGASVNDFFNQLLKQAETAETNPDANSEELQEAKTRISELIGNAVKREQETNQLKLENEGLKKLVSELEPLREIFDLMNETPDTFKEKLQKVSESGINEDTIFLNLNEADHDIIESLLIIAQKQGFAANYEELITKIIAAFQSQGKLVPTAEDMEYLKQVREGGANG